MPYDFHDEIIPADVPKVRRTYSDGSTAILEGDDALKLTQFPGAVAWRNSDPNNAVSSIGIELDPRNRSLGYELGAKLKKFSEGEPTLVGKAMEDGPLTGGLTGGAIGAGIGAAGGWLFNKLLADNPVSVGKAATLTGIIGALLGAHNGYVRSTTPMYKRAAMFHDPRNFILEKLQSATDVGLAEKAKLAAAVRNMDVQSASKLADAVRAAIGFGVGAIISKFIFGTNGPGTLFGGLAGVIGVNYLMKTFAPKPANPLDVLNQNPFTYRNIL